MSVKQIVSPNLDPIIRQPDGKGGSYILRGWLAWCLAYVQYAFNSGWAGSTAWQAWTGRLNYKHEDRNFPKGVYFPIWFRYKNNGEEQGHVAIAYVNGVGQIGIWSSPITDKPYADTWSSIEEVERNYHCTYVGWSEDIGDTRVIEVATDPEPTPEPSTPSISYVKLEKPLNLVTKAQPTNKWDIGFKQYPEAKAAVVLEAGTPFVAYGKAVKNDLADHPVYFMNEADFGQADMTGTPIANQGINTIDLSPAPEQVEAAAPMDKPVVVETPSVPTKFPPMTDVVPVDPNPWQKTVKLNKADYRSKEAIIVKDLTGLMADQELPAGQLVHIAQRLVKDGVTYGRTAKAITDNRWHAVPLDKLELVKEINVEDDDDSVFDEISMDVSETAKAVVSKFKNDGTFREKIVNWVAKHIFRTKKQK